MEPRLCDLASAGEKRLRKTSCYNAKARTEQAFVFFLVSFTTLHQRTNRLFKHELLFFIFIYLFLYIARIHGWFGALCLHAWAVSRNLAPSLILHCCQAKSLLLVYLGAFWSPMHLVQYPYMMALRLPNQTQRQKYSPFPLLQEAHHFEELIIVALVAITLPLGTVKSQRCGENDSCLLVLHCSPLLNGLVLKQFGVVTTI